MPAASVDQILDYAATAKDRYYDLPEKTFTVDNYKVIVYSPANVGRVFIKVHLIKGGK